MSYTISSLLPQTLSNRSSMIFAVESHTSLLFGYKTSRQWTRQEVASISNAHLRERRGSDLPVSLPFVSFGGHNVPPKERQSFVDIDRLGEARPIPRDFL